MAGQAWYCPGCGIGLDTDLLCPRCRLSLKDLQHLLIELHPHTANDGNGR